jgi:hypothetical protein
LLAAAEAVAAVEIVSADYSLTANDGPMVAAAKVLKVLKGPLTPGRDVRFFETWWRGLPIRKVSTESFFSRRLRLQKSLGELHPGCQENRFLHRKRRRFGLVLAVVGRVPEPDRDV